MGTPPGTSPGQTHLVSRHFVCDVRLWRAAAVVPSLLSVTLVSNLAEGNILEKTSSLTSGQRALENVTSLGCSLFHPMNSHCATTTTPNHGTIAGTGE